jgi:hypothetical protein
MFSFLKIQNYIKNLLSFNFHIFKKQNFLFEKQFLELIEYVQNLNMYIMTLDSTTFYNLFPASKQELENLLLTVDDRRLLFDKSYFSVFEKFNPRSNIILPKELINKISKLILIYGLPCQNPRKTDCVVSIPGVKIDLDTKDKFLFNRKEITLHTFLKLWIDFFTELKRQADKNGVNLAF